MVGPVLIQSPRRVFCRSPESEFENRQQIPAILFLQSGGGVSNSERSPKLGAKTPSRRLARSRVQDISPLNHLRDNQRESRIHEDN